jgi:hypothetical protein
MLASGRHSARNSAARSPVALNRQPATSYASCIDGGSHWVLTPPSARGFFLCSYMDRAADGVGGKGAIEGAIAFQGSDPARQPRMIGRTFQKAGAE